VSRRNNKNSSKGQTARARKTVTETERREPERHGCSDGPVGPNRLHFLASSIASAFTSSQASASRTVMRAQSEVCADAAMLGGAFREAFSDAQ
jgi:hypothetical protein